MAIAVDNRTLDPRGGDRRDGGAAPGNRLLDRRLRLMRQCQRDLRSRCDLYSN